MTIQNPFNRAAKQPSVPRGDVLGTFDTYVEAQQTVDKLSKAELDIKKLSIVGNDLKTVERVTGKLSNGRAALGGAASGAWLGLFVGLVFFLISPTPEFSTVASAALVGAGFGMLFGIATYSLGRRRRDFTSTHQVVASNYQVIVETSLAAKAREILSGVAAPATVDAAAEAPAPVEPEPAPEPAPEPDKTAVMPVEPPAATPVEAPTEVLPIDDPERRR